MYELSPEGHQRLKQAQVNALRELERHDYLIDAALSDGRGLSDEEVAAALEARREAQGELVKSLDDRLADMSERLELVVPPGGPRRGAAIALGLSALRHAQALARAELAWLDDLVAALRTAAGVG